MTDPVISETKSESKSYKYDRTAYSHHLGDAGLGLLATSAAAFSGAAVYYNFKGKYDLDESGLAAFLQTGGTDPVQAQAQFGQHKEIGKLVTECAEGVANGTMALDFKSCVEARVHGVEQQHIGNGFTLIALAGAATIYFGVEAVRAGCNAVRARLGYDR